MSAHPTVSLLIIEFLRKKKKFKFPKKLFLFLCYIYVILKLIYLFFYLFLCYKKWKWRKKKVSKRRDNTFCDYEKEEVESTEKLNKRRNKNLHCVSL